MNKKIKPISAIAIKQAQENLELIKKVALQIQKDFQCYDEEITWSANTENPYQDLFNQVKPIIGRMLNLDTARFFSLLYAIDINEEKVKEVLFGTEDLDAAHELTLLILERELLKVMSRVYFSKSL